jgi:hypothetical protein
VPLPIPKPYPVHVPVYKHIHHYPKILYRHGWHWGTTSGVYPSYFSLSLNVRCSDIPVCIKYRV